MKKITILMLYLLFAAGLWAQTEVQQIRKLSYFNQTQVALLIGEESEDQTRKALIPSFQTVNGIRIGENWGLGIGLGVEPYEYVAFPVFFSSYYFFNAEKASPYFAFKGGYSFANSHKNLNYYYNGKYDNKGGWMFNPEIGIRFKASTFEITLSSGYRFQRLNSNITQDGSLYTYNRRVDYKRVSFALGIMF